ncbi:hypothetical protein VTN00DRAFT_1464 [Thermoascus crustaceus]|uniref:uncharacterized protein n=1 Tax=Thermoascus crustaceus TaxID=5088 RepID=UPI00374490FE
MGCGTNYSISILDSWRWMWEARGNIVLCFISLHQIIDIKIKIASLTCSILVRFHEARRPNDSLTMI